MIWPKEGLFHTVGKKWNRLPWEAVMLWKGEKVWLEKELMWAGVERDGLLPHLSLCDDLLGQDPSLTPLRAAWFLPSGPKSSHVF